MLKCRLPQFPVHPHLNDGRQGAGNIVGDTCEQDRDKVQDDKDCESVKYFSADKMIQCIPLKQGQDDIHQAAAQAAENHNSELLPHFSQIRKDLADPEKFKMFCRLLFHYPITSWEPVWVS